MRAVYKNPKELYSKLRDLVDTYKEDLISYEKLEDTVLLMIEKNPDRIYKNGFMPTPLASVLGEERKAVLDKIAEKILQQ